MIKLNTPFSPVLSLSTLLLLTSTGCQKERVEVPLPEDNIVPTPNQDGNYNVILITTDQEHYMSEYPVGSNFRGRERMRRLGVSFTNHYVCATVSTASRSALYTGMHIPHTRMLDNTNYKFQPAMSEEITTVGDRMGRLGYYCAYKGKWHLGKHGEGDFTHALQGYGFDEWSKEGDTPCEAWDGFTQDGKIATQAIDFLKDKGSELNRNGKSFFLAVNFINPHDVMYFDSDPSNDPKPHVIETKPAPAHELYTVTYPFSPIPSTWNEAPDAAGRVNAHREYFYNWNKMVGIVPNDPQHWALFRDYYYNCIQDSDNQMQQLLDHLAQRGMLNNTIIILTADHGEMLGAHGLRGKAGFMYEENIHVPMIIFHPEQKGGRRCHSITSHLDITPTIVDAASSPQKQSELATLKGYSLWPLVKDPSKSVRDTEGALFVYDMISMIDGSFVLSPLDHNYKIDMTKRGFVRGVITRDFKFARYFSPVNFNTPTTLEQLYAQNDVEMFRRNNYLGSIPETENLAADRENQQERILEYNAKLNALIDREIGFNDGRETDVFPGGIWNYAKRWDE